MRYTLTSVSGHARRVFKENVTYDDRDIVAKVRREGLYVTRPNGSQRIRGSGRLLVWSGDRIVDRFERHTIREERSIQPEPVGTIQGRIT